MSALETGNAGLRGSDGEPHLSDAGRSSFSHKTKSVAAADEIRKRILSGQYAPGAPLRQDSLAADLGMSRIPIREALVLLESEGVVRILPHRGAVVSQLSLDEIEELFNMRMLLEPFILRRSAPSLTSGDFASLKRVLEQYAASLQDTNASRWNDLNAEFHLLLYRHARSPRVVTTVATLLQECDRHTRLQLTNIAGGRERAVAEHTELLRLCELRAFDTAAELMKEHIRQIGADLIGILESNKPATE